MRAAVPLLGVTEKERVHCFFGKTAPPEFTLTFPYGALAVDQVDASRTCMVMIDLTNQTISISADISRIVDPWTLELIARESVVHAQNRSYFRVDATAKVAASSPVPESTADEGERWRLQGDTIDLSGSGVLCSFSEPLEKDKKVKIELALPTRDIDVIMALGHVARCRQIEKQLYHVALHFDLLDSESQDKIMACCFELQRRHLRMRVLLENQPAQ